MAVALVRWLDADEEFAWFAYEPLTEEQAVAVVGRPGWWPALLVVPVVLAALSAAVVLVAARRRPAPGG